MSIRRIPLLLLLLTLGALALVGGCETKPTEPSYGNLFDPDGPDGGDPFHLVATYGSGKINLVWTHPEGYGITSYDVLQSPTYFGEYFSIAPVTPPTEGIAFFAWDGAEPNSTNFFKIQAYDSDGNHTATSHIAPVSLTTPALVFVNDNNVRSTATRHIELHITVSEGDSLRLSQGSQPTTETVIAAGDSGVAVSLDWDLGEAADNDTTMVVNVVTQLGVSLGDTNKVRMDVDFAPSLGLKIGGTRIGALRPDLKIPTTGMLNMRFAASEEELADQIWLPALGTYNQYQLEDTTAPQTIYAEFLGDFGFSIIDDLTVTADLLEDPGFYLALPEDHITEQSTVMGICDAVATQMRFSESLDFSGVTWQAYRDTAMINLSEGAGQKVIYGQFRNDFAQSGILTDYAIYLSQPLAIGFTAPAENDTITGGTILLVQGLTTAPNGSTPVDSVKVNLGEDWVDTWGTTNWRYTWTTPVVEEITDVVLRARAWAAGDSATSVRNVTMVPQ